MERGGFDVTGPRYEAREGVADGDFLLKLVERGGAEVGRQQYLSWRNTGIAYRLADRQRAGFL